MRASDAREILEAAHVDPTLYSFEGNRDETICMFADGRIWTVFIGSRGKRLQERTFPDEDSACVYFLKLMFHHEGSRPMRP